MDNEQSQTRNHTVSPLHNLQFYIHTQFDNEEEIKEKVEGLGGVVVEQLTNEVVAVISTKDDLSLMSDTMVIIQENNIEVVEASIFDMIDPNITCTIAETLQLVNENNIADWGSDPATRISQDTYDGNSSNNSTNSTSDVKFLKIKGGTAVDPDSELEHQTHVYRDAEGVHYTAVLCRTDVVEDRNSFYKLQVLEADDKTSYWLFRSWGRIGTDRGSHTNDECCSAEGAITLFKEVYKKHTGNHWEAREVFQKMPGFYYQLDVDYKAEETIGKLEVDENSSLPISVQKLLIRIFDIELMNSTIREFKLDTKKMPLGNLSKNQIRSGLEILYELLLCIEDSTVNQKMIEDATNRFFTKVPHDFGNDNPPLLDNINLISDKILMLDNLLEIEISYNLLTSEVDEDDIDIDGRFKKLKTDITPLETNSEEFQMIQEYVKNTHGPTHTKYELEIQEVFKINRENEEDRYKKFKELGNRRLLWHGSRILNYAGIFSEGLRMRPPNACFTGDMFGNGIYFADMVTKSANYCGTSPSNNVGLVLLCEVALGNMKYVYWSDKEELQEHHSKYAIGEIHPSPASRRQLPCGVLVPLGRPVHNHDMELIPTDDARFNNKLTLRYNEYIVFDVDQVNIKYLVQMKFNYKNK